ncbi:oligoribonuclease [Naviculisporaceae sp. PSN 640]
MGPDREARGPGDKQSEAAFVWIDCEMTGLNPDSDSIIEIFCLVTDSQLNLLDESGWGTVIHQPKERMDAMDEWCTRVHGESGLTAAVLESTVSPDQAADELLDYVTKWAPRARTALLAGNSVHADLAFLRKKPYKRVIDHLHYRILDVSSIKEATRSWRPDLASKAPVKKGLHKARDDILESIEEARYYKAAVFQAHSA